VSNVFRAIGIIVVGTVELAAGVALTAIGAAFAITSAVISAYIVVIGGVIAAHVAVVGIAMTIPFIPLIILLSCL